MKIDTILVLVDFTEMSKNAIQYAIKLSENSNIKIVYLHIFITEVPSILTGIINAPMVSTNLGVEREKSQASVRAFLESISDTQNTEYEIVVEPGREITDDIICEVALSKMVDLIILGVTTSSLLERFFVGTLGEKVSRKAFCSVMIVPESFKVFKLKTMSLMVDKKDFDNLMQPAIINQLIKKFNGFLYIVHVANENDIKLTREDVIENYVSHLNQNVFSLYFFEDDNPHEAIEKFIYEKPIDLSILMYQEHNYLERVFQPGLRRKLAFKTDIPLLVLK